MLVVVVGELVVECWVEDWVDYYVYFLDCYCLVLFFVWVDVE